MRRGWAWAVAVVVPIVFGIGGAIVGGIVGNAIAPANLTWSGSSTPGLLFHGLILGFVGGLGGGIWAGTRVVREAKRRHPAPPVDPVTRRRRRNAAAASIGLALAALIAFIAWPRPICEERQREALLAVPTYGDLRVAVVDTPDVDHMPTGCEMTYTVAAPARVVADHYAQELYRHGWRNALADLGQVDLIAHLNDDPYRLWIEVTRSGPDPYWKNMFFDVGITEVDDSHVRVEAAVTDRGCPYC